MIIRKIQSEDLHDIFNLSQQLGYTFPKDKLAKRISELESSSNDIVYIAFSPNSENVVGYIHLQIYKTLYFEPLLNILGFVVDQKYRHNGIGTVLIKKAEEYAVQNKCTGIRANSGSTRESAHHFYRNNGFDNEKDQKRFLRILPSLYSI